MRIIAARNWPEGLIYIAKNCDIRWVVYLWTFLKEVECLVTTRCIKDFNRVSVGHFV